MLKNTTIGLSAAGKLLALSIVLALQGCAKPQSEDRQKSIPNKQVLVIGHAGSGFLSPLNPFNPLPPNSMASIKKAFDNGADGVEVDVQLSQDGEAILYHDPTLDTFTNASGLIDTMKAREVLGLPYKAGILYEAFQDEKIISLERLLRFLSAEPRFPYLQLDLRNHTPERRDWYAATLTALLRKYRYPLEKLVLISPDEELLLAFRKAEPHMPLLMDTDGDFDATLSKVRQYKFDGIVVASKAVGREQVLLAKRQGLQIILFGGKSGAAIENILAKGPDAVEVNNVKKMRELLD